MVFLTELLVSLSGVSTPGLAARELEEQIPKSVQPNEQTHLGYKITCNVFAYTLLERSVAVLRVMNPPNLATYIGHFPYCGLD